MSSSLQSYSRQLVALEEAHVTNSDFAASTMTSTVAQIQARVCLLGSLCSKQCACQQALVDIAEKLVQPLCLHGSWSRYAHVAQTLGGPGNEWQMMLGS